MPHQGWPAGVPCTHVSTQVDGSTLTAAASASMLPGAGKYTFEPNFFQMGSVLLIKATGRISSVVTTPGTARFDIRLGGTVVFDSLAILLDTVAGYTNVGWTLEIMLTLRIIGAGIAQFWGQGRWDCTDILGTPPTAPKGGINAILPWNSAPALGTAFDSTVSQQFDSNFTQTVATGSLTCHQFMVQSPN